MKFSELFKKEINELGKILVEAPWHNEKFYTAWLAQTYYFVKESSRLLMLCGSRIPQENTQLHFRFIKHAAEEKGHEFLLLKDLKKLGHSVEEVLEFSSTAGFYQSQYFWIEHRNPLAFFGYVLVLEGLASVHGDRVHAQALKAFGSEATSFLKVHAEEDPDHTEKALKELESLSGESMRAVEENFRLALGAYAQILRDCQHYAQFQPRFEKSV